MSKRGKNRIFSLRKLFPENRRGSHIDVIISFVIFIGFIVFLYAILQPTIASHQDKSAVLNSLQYKLSQNLTGDFVKISFSINQQSGKCVQLSNFFANTGLTPNMVITDAAGAVFPSYVSGSDLWIDISTLSGSFYAVYSPSYSSLPPNNLKRCNNLKQDNQNNYYSIIQTTNYSSGFLSGSSVISLINLYNGDYNSVKNYFGVSPSDNFGFNFTYQNRTSIGTNDGITPSVSVYSELFPEVYVNENGSLQAGALTVRVW